MFASLALGSLRASLAAQADVLGLRFGLEVVPRSLAARGD
jgi:hypothetical protein